MKLKDESYFKRQNAKLMKKDPIMFMEYVAKEMLKIARHEGNKEKQEFYTTVSLIAQKYL